jgi:NADP-dependent 3-hydroxy acid dehydrogenase YdfG
MTSSKDPYVNLQQPGTGRTVAVTGASKGIDAAVVRRLVGDGFVWSRPSIQQP